MLLWAPETSPATSYLLAEDQVALQRKTVIPGFNTDIEHEGVTYHVQTEDKGLDSPLILSLIYTGGAILASKRTPYEDLVAAGLDEKMLAERLQRQHTLICAAIRAGRIDDLKRLSDKDHERAPAARARRAPKSEATPVVAAPPAADDVTAPLPEARAVHPPPVAATLTSSAPPSAPAPSLPGPQKSPSVPPARVPAGRKSEARPHVEPRPSADNTFASFTLDSKLHLATGPLTADINGLHLCLLDEQELRAGEQAVLCIRVGKGLNGADPVAEAEVTVKILGTTFHPIIINLKTNQFGMTVARASLPRFNAGRAAVLVRAEFDGKEAMLRRVINRA